MKLCLTMNVKTDHFTALLAIATAGIEEMTDAIIAGTEEMTDRMTAGTEEMTDRMTAGMITGHGDSAQIDTLL